MSTEHFPATLGSRERRRTLAAVGVAVVGLTIIGVIATVQTGEPLWLFVGLPFSLYVWAIGRYAPLGYRLAADGVHVERRAGAKVIPYGVIRGVDRLPRPLKGLSATASKGIFGYFGGFWNTSLGFYRLYLTNDQNIVWLDTRYGWVGLSPDRPDEFVERLRDHIR